MSSLALDFGAADRVAYYERRMHLAVNDAAFAMGMGVAASACGLKTSAQLREMIDGTNGRRLSTPIAAIVAERVGPGALRDAILDAIKGMFGLYQPEADGPYIHRLEGALLRFGEPGAQALAQCRREARR